MIPLAQLLNTFQSTILGTIGENGYPFGSYAPFFYDGERLYIYISQLATHTQNLLRTPKASALFIDDETHTDNIFARKRISLQCDAEEIVRDTPLYDEILTQLQQRHGETIAMLRGLDFRLFALTPIYGEATFGFAKAYILGGEAMNALYPRAG